MIEVSETPDCRREMLPTRTDRNNTDCQIESTLQDIPVGAFLYPKSAKFAHTEVTKVPFFVTVWYRLKI